MTTARLQQLKMAWLAAKEADDQQTQFLLLRDHPEEQNELIDFISAYYATSGSSEAEQDMLLPATQRACLTALDRVFGVATQVAAQRAFAFANLAELRQSLNLQKKEAAKGLRLSLDVWHKFETGAIELASLSQRQIERLASFFSVSIEQFSQSLQGSQPSLNINRRQTKANQVDEPFGPPKQSITEAIARSSMSKEDRQFWLEDM